MSVVTISSIPNNEPITRELIERALATRRDGLPADVATLARQCVLDCIGAAIAGARDPLLTMLIEDALDQGGHPAASVIARRVRVSPQQAALINGTASHMLDYDDVNININGHPSAVILPALLAAGEGLERTGADLLAAFVAGYELACRVGTLIGPGHYLRGFHSTATVGAFGAAMACAHLMRLDPLRASWTLGIAGTQAAGLKAMFGTPCKPMHAGFAAQNGLRAAMLAQRGVASRTDVVECRRGFAATHSPDYHPERALGDPGRYFIRENLFKYHAACYNTHAAIECVQRLRQESRLNPADVDGITVRVEQGADAICNIAEPSTGLEAKFSVRFCIALACMERDTGDLNTFSDAATSDPDLVALRDKVKVELVPGWPLMKSGVMIELASGKRIAAELDAGVPNTDLETQETRLRAKFTTLTAPVLGAARSAALLNAIDGIDRITIGDLVKACRSE